MRKATNPLSSRLIAGIVAAWQCGRPELSTVTERIKDGAGSVEGEG